MKQGRWIDVAIFGSGGIILEGLAVAVVAEAVAIATNRATISKITANAVRRKPGLSNALIAGCCLLMGALVAHFTDWEP